MNDSNSQGKVGEFGYSSCRISIKGGPATLFLDIGGSQRLKPVGDTS